MGRGGGGRSAARGGGEGPARDRQIGGAGFGGAGANVTTPQRRTTEAGQQRTQRRAEPRTRSRGDSTPQSFSGSKSNSYRGYKSESRDFLQKADAWEQMRPSGFGRFGGTSKAVQTEGKYQYLRQEWRKAARAAHPDRGGSLREAQVVNSRFQSIKQRWESGGRFRTL